MNKVQSEETAYLLIEEFEKYLSPTLTDKGIDLSVYTRKLFYHGEILAYKEKQGMIGYYLNKEERLCFVSILAIAPEYQRRGIGRSLLEELMAKARTEGCGVLKLAVEKDNSNGIKFYEKLDFIYVNETESQYLLMRNL